MHLLPVACVRRSFSFSPSAFPFVYPSVGRCQWAWQNVDSDTTAHVFLFRRLKQLMTAGRTDGPTELSIWPFSAGLLVGRQMRATRVARKGGETGRPEVTDGMAAAAAASACDGQQFHLTL